MRLPTLEEVLGSIDRPNIPMDIRAEIGSFGISGAEFDRLAHYCTGERLERTGRVALGVDSSLGSQEPGLPSVTVGLLERITS